MQRPTNRNYLKRYRTFPVSGDNFFPLRVLARSKIVRPRKGPRDAKEGAKFAQSLVVERNAVLLVVAKRSRFLSSGGPLARRDHRYEKFVREGILRKTPVGHRNEV